MYNLCNYKTGWVPGAASKWLLGLQKIKGKEKKIKHGHLKSYTFPLFIVSYYYYFFVFFFYLWMLVFIHHVFVSQTVWNLLTNSYACNRTTNAASLAAMYFFFLYTLQLLLTLWDVDSQIRNKIYIYDKYARIFFFALQMYIALGS